MAHLTTHDTLAPHRWSLLPHVVGHEKRLCLSVFWQKKNSTDQVIGSFICMPIWCSLR